jgi:hypothetical protein
MAPSASSRDRGRFLVRGIPTVFFGMRSMMLHIGTKPEMAREQSLPALQNLAGAVATYLLLPCQYPLPPWRTMSHM